MEVHREAPPGAQRTQGSQDEHCCTSDARGGHKQSAVDFSSEQYAVQEGTSSWQLVSSDIMKNSLHDCIASNEYEEKNQYPIEVEAKEAEVEKCEALIMK